MQVKEAVQGKPGPEAGLRVGLQGVSAPEFPYLSS